MRLTWRPDAEDGEPSVVDGGPRPSELGGEDAGALTGDLTLEVKDVRSDDGQRGELGDGEHREVRLRVGSERVEREEGGVAAWARMDEGMRHMVNAGPSPFDPRPPG